MTIQEIVFGPLKLDFTPHFLRFVVQVMAKCLMPVKYLKTVLSGKQGHSSCKMVLL